ncbi:MAG: DUF362 domain-containing protein [Promethearchaeota archaeon]
MLKQLNLENAEVSIIKGESPSESVLEGIEKLGGISKYINEGDQVFIKFNLTLPNGFPVNTNFDVLEVVIRSCKKAGANKIFLGSFPFKGFTIKEISDILGIKSYFKNLGAELLFLDNSDFYALKGKKLEKLKQIKDNSFSEIIVNNKKVIVPKVLLKSDKFISINQVNVNPLFKCNLSLLNSYSVIPNNYQDIKKVLRKGKNYFYLDQYKKDLISDILDVFAIRKPDLVINDLFYLLEGAGPYIYKDSKIKKTGLIIIGNDAVAVDYITIRLMNLEMIENDLILEARDRKLGTAKLSNIKISGENLDATKINVDFCSTRLEDIKVRNFSIKSGQYCSGCFKQAYHLLNFIKTNLIKDLKYIPRNSFLIGEKPKEPDSLENITLFGDCAINTTKNRNFRNIKTTTKKNKIKTKKNKNILELSGCPPDILKCMEQMIKFYGKSNVPTLNLYNKIINSNIHRATNKMLKNWEAF